MAKRGNPNFKKGVSGNPSGRPKELPGLIERCRGWAHTKGVDLLIEIAQDKTQGRMQLAAIQYLVDRGFGRIPETIKHEGLNQGADLSDIPVDTLKKVRDILTAAVEKKKE